MEAVVIVVLVTAAAAGAGYAGVWAGRRSLGPHVHELETRLLGSAVAETRRYLISLLWWTSRVRDGRAAGARPEPFNFPQQDIALVGDSDVILAYLSALAMVADKNDGRRLTADEWREVRAVSRRVDAALTEQDALLAVGRPVNRIADEQARSLVGQFSVVAREAALRPIPMVAAA